MGVLLRFADGAQMPAERVAWIMALLKTCVPVFVMCRSRLQRKHAECTTRDTCRNMEPVFGSDEWPEQERNRRRDAVHKEARYVFVHRDSQENRGSACASARGSAADEEVLGFVHYRFVVEEDVAVLYVYELQVSGARPCIFPAATCRFGSDADA